VSVFMLLGTHSVVELAGIRSYSKWWALTSVFSLNLMR